MSVRWLLWSVLSPSQVLAGAAVAGGLLLAFGRERAGRRLSVFGGVGLLLFGLLPLSHYIATPLEARYPQPQLPARISGIVLLTGGESPEASEVHGEPQINWAGGRYTTVLRLAAEYPDAALVVTGGPKVNPETGRPGQTNVAQQILLGAGIRPARLIFENASVDTCENATNTKARVNPKPGEAWVVVTSAIHVPRTMACFRAAGWDVIAQPADYHSMPRARGVGAFQATENLKLLDMSLHEWLGLVYYRLWGRTEEFFPSPASRERAG